MKFLAGLVPFVLLLSGCAGSISQPTASRALVDNDFALERATVPKQYWQQIDSAVQGRQITVEGKTLLVGEPYFSASGSKCKPLFYKGSDVSAWKNQTVCKQLGESAWFFAPQVIATYSSVNGGGQR